MGKLHGECIAVGKLALQSLVLCYYLRQLQATSSLALPHFCQLLSDVFFVLIYCQYILVCLIFTGFSRKIKVPISGLRLAWLGSIPGFQTAQFRSVLALLLTDLQALCDAAVAAVGMCFAFLKEPMAVPAACPDLPAGERRTVISFSMALRGCVLNFSHGCSRQQHGHMVKLPNKLLG